MADASPNQTKWSLAGDYFETCNCNVLCPCLISTSPPMTARPTEGDCHVALFFHVDRGSYGAVKLDGLNLVVCASSDGPMGQGNWTGATYVDERADDGQMEALGAIFSGATGGPMAAFAPLFGRVAEAWREVAKGRFGAERSLRGRSRALVCTALEGARAW